MEVTHIKGILTAKEASELVVDDMVLMVGGFLGAGSPDLLIDSLVASEKKNLTLIANDTGFPERGVGKLVVNGQLKKVIVSHIGTNKFTGDKMNSGEMEVELVPQGTLAEQIRAGGAGLGGILTATGIGTVAQEGKQIITLDGQDYILARPLKADIAFVKASRADKAGNLVYRLSARNFNPLVAMAARLVIAEVEDILEIGEIQPDEVMTPGIFVDYLVKSGVA